MAVQASGAVVLLDQPAPHIARLRINRPDRRNAIDQAVRRQLREALGEVDALAAAGSVRALVFGGVGGVFSAGGDLPTMGGLDTAGCREGFAAFGERRAPDFGNPAAEGGQ